MKSHVPAKISKSKFQKSQKHNNPNLRDSDQRERERELTSPARGLGSHGLGSPLGSYLMSSWCGLDSSLMSSSLMGRMRPRFFFFFFLWVLLWSSGWVFIRVINRVLETRFSCGRHMEKMPHQTWFGHGNRVFDTQFINQNRVL